MKDFHQEQRKQGWYGVTRWNKEDVHAYRKDVELYQWTDEIAEAWLAGIERSLQDRMTQVGWEVIETLMGEEE